MHAGRIADRINVQRQDVGGVVVGLEFGHRAARGVGLDDRMIGVFLADDVVAALEVGGRGAAPEGLVLVFPEADGGMVFEPVDQTAQFGFGGRVTGGKRRHLAQIDPAKHALLGGPIQRVLLIGNERVVPIAGLGDAEQQRAGLAKFLQGVLAPGGCAAIGRPGRKADGEDLLAVDDQHAVGVDRDDRTGLGAGERPRPGQAKREQGRAEPKTEARGFGSS